MTKLRAILWDVDGTLAETERDGHRVAFNLAFEEAGLPWRWDEMSYGELLMTAGGRERLVAYLDTRADAPRDKPAREALARRLHRRKNAFYADRVRRERLPMRAGVRALMDECDERRVVMAITTTTGRSNLDALLRMQLGTAWRERFAAVVCAEEVRSKKPDPQVFERALEQLDIEPGAAVAVEDSPDGAAAAQAAGVPVIVTRSAYFSDVHIPGALAVGPGLHTRRGWQPQPGGPVGHQGIDGGIRLDDVAAWHAARTSCPPTDRAAGSS